MLAAQAEAQQSPVALNQYERSRAEMLADLDDPEKAFVFAESAVAVGDIRGAIDALERVLTLNPGLTNIRFELGLLYLRGGSPELAESYLLEVLEDPQTPEPIKLRAQDLIEEIGLQKSRHVFRGTVTTGLRHDSNANTAPDRLLVGGIPFNIADQDRSTSDVSAVLSFRMQHLYDLGGQYGPFIDTELTVFSQSYQDVSSSDITFVGATSGPRFRFGLDGQHSVRPYIGASTLFLGQEHYGNAARVGTEWTHALDPRTEVRAEIDARWQNLFNSDVNPTAENFEGRQITARFGFRRALTARLAIDTALSLTDSNLDASFESNVATGIELSLRQSVGNPFGSNLDPANLSLTAGYALAEYDQANPQVDPNVVQEDDRWRIGLDAAIPVAEQWLLNAGLAYARNDSNLPNDSYDNLQISIGVSYNFRRLR